MSAAQRSALPGLLVIHMAKCDWPCRFRAASRLPSYLIPLELAACSVEEIHQCNARNRTRTGHPPLPIAPRPQLLVAMTAIPPRSQTSKARLGRAGTSNSPLELAIRSIFAQQRPADRILLSTCARYTRFPGAQQVTLPTLLMRHGSLEHLDRCDDHGPGTKLLCALPRLRLLASAFGRRGGAAEQEQGGVPPSPAPGASSSSWVVLADDDQRYRPWGLQYLERAIMDDADGARLAYSYDTYTLDPDGHAVMGGVTPGLLVGSGHALLAVRVDMLDGFEAFSACVREAEPRSAYHDDVVLSMYLQDVKRALIYRLGGTPFEMASKGCLPNTRRVVRTPLGPRGTCRVRIGAFPEVHEPTRSFLSKGALLRLEKDYSGPVVGGATAHNGTAASWSVASLQGSDSLLRSGASVEEVRQAYSRLAITRAMGQARARILRAGLCGLSPRNLSSASSYCVGDWCQAVLHGAGPRFLA